MLYECACCVHMLCVFACVCTCVYVFMSKCVSVCVVHVMCTHAHACACVHVCACVLHVSVFVCVTCFFHSCGSQIVYSVWAI